MGNIEENIEKLNNFYKLIEDKASQITEYDINELEKSYTLSDGTIFKGKIINDLSMWKSFARDYGFDKLGIRYLREILGDPNKFKEEHLK